jgi:hypothetical protein
MRYLKFWRGLADVLIRKMPTRLHSSKRNSLTDKRCATAATYNLTQTDWRRNDATPLLPRYDPVLHEILRKFIHMHIIVIV